MDVVNIIIYFMKNSSVVRKQQVVWYLIFGQALLAFLGSLYLSNFGDPLNNIAAGEFFSTARALDPCHLCWWARILMYPILLISLVGIIKKDKRFTDYILPLAVPGVLLALYHYSIQMFPAESDFGASAVCDVTNPCNAINLLYLDFITIPFMGLVAFAVITVLCLLNWHYNRQSPQS